jgi:hypothetical protein
MVVLHHARTATCSIYSNHSLDMRTDRKPSLGRAVSRGAIAGLIGGAAMTAAERVVLPRLPGRRTPRIVPWDARVADAFDIIGWDMSPRSRTAAGITTQLLYAALLGAAYAALVSRKPSRAARDLADAALVFAASLITPELPRSKRRKRGSRLTRLGRRAAEPITVPRVFGRATTLALRAMERVS